MDPIRGQERLANGERYRPGDLPAFVAEDAAKIVEYAASGSSGRGRISA